MLNAEMSFISLRYCLIATFPDIISLTSVVEKQIGVVPIDCKFQDFGLVRFVLVLTFNFFNSPQVKFITIPCAGVLANCQHYK